MKILPTIILLLVLATHAMAQSENPLYDEALATSLGADEYGMKPYVLAILKSGSYQPADKKIIEKLFRGHMENISKMAAEGKLVIAGPVGKNDKSYRGIYIFNVKTLAEATQLLESDPAVKEKLLDAELYEWYGSAALPEYLKTHEKIEKKKP